VAQQAQSFQSPAVSESTRHISTHSQVKAKALESHSIANAPVSLGEHRPTGKQELVHTEGDSQGAVSDILMCRQPR